MILFVTLCNFKLALARAHSEDCFSVNICEPISDLRVSAYLGLLLFAPCILGAAKIGTGPTLLFFVST